MAIANRRVHEDVGSELMVLMLEQLNRLTAAVQALSDTIVNAADFAGLQTDTAALTELDAFEDIQPTVVRPAGPRIPLS